MNPWDQLERLEAWVEELRTTDDDQARGTYGWTNEDAVPDCSCCLRIANKVRGSHEKGERGAVEWLGLRRGEHILFMKMNDKLQMSYHEIADAVIAKGITPLREALGLGPYDEDEE